MAITQLEAKIIAEKYVAELGEVLPGYIFGISEIQILNLYFYFDFILLNLEKQIPKNPPMVGGAPGIIIDKNSGKVEIISFSKLSSLVSEKSNS